MGDNIDPPLPPTPPPPPPLSPRQRRRQQIRPLPPLSERYKAMTRRAVVARDEYNERELNNKTFSDRIVRKDNSPPKLHPEIAEHSKSHMRSISHANNDFRCAAYARQIRVEAGMTLSPDNEALLRVVRDLNVQATGRHSSWNGFLHFRRHGCSVNNGERFMMGPFSSRCSALWKKVSFTERATYGNIPTRKKIYKTNEFFLFAYRTRKPGQSMGEVRDAWDILGELNKNEFSRMTRSMNAERNGEVIQLRPEMNYAPLPPLPGGVRDMALDEELPPPPPPGPPIEVLPPVGPRHHQQLQLEPLPPVLPPVGAGHRQQLQLEPLPPVLPPVGAGHRQQQHSAPYHQQQQHAAPYQYEAPHHASWSLQMPGPSNRNDYEHYVAHELQPRQNQQNATTNDDFRSLREVLRRVEQRREYGSPLEGFYYSQTVASIKEAIKQLQY